MTNSDDWEQIVETLAFEYYKLTEFVFEDHSWEDQWATETDKYRESIRNDMRQLLDTAHPAMLEYYGKFFISLLRAQTEYLDALTITCQTQTDALRMQVQRQGVLHAIEVIKVASERRSE